MARHHNWPGWSDYVQELGDHAFQIRTERGMSQENVAYAAGLTRYTYQRLERGLGTNALAANPTLATLVAVAQALDVGLEDLIPLRELPTFEERILPPPSDPGQDASTVPRAR